MLLTLNSAGKSGQAARTRIEATITADIPAGTDINGPSFAGNCSVDLPAYDEVVFATSVNVYLNGALMLATDVSAGTSPADGDIRFAFPLFAVGTADPDELVIVVYGQ